MTYHGWLESDARLLLDQIPKSVVEWICTEDMTEEEKEAYPTHKTTGGYLKVLDESQCGQIWWDGLSQKEKDVIKSIPNFNSDIFRNCTGITVEG